MNRYLRLNAIMQSGQRISIVVNLLHIVAVAEHPEGQDKRPTTEVILHGGIIFKVIESVEDITRWMNTPDSFSGPVINPQEAL